MRAFRQRAEYYPALRHSLGFKLVDHGRPVVQFAWSEPPTTLLLESLYP